METRNPNNEFENMPSVDYGRYISIDINKKNKSRIDFLLAKEICKKYGFDCTYINSTFCGDDAEFVVYTKLDIDTDYYEELSNKYYLKDDKASGILIRSIYNGLSDTFLNLHKCVHELDEQTCLMFECGWSGNCGLFGSNDVRRQTYSFGDRIYEWKSITNRWSPLIHDTRNQLSKGVYVIMPTRYIKPEMQQSPLLEDFEPKLIKIVRGLIGKGYTADFENGKRQCDGNEKSYRALVVRYAESGEYCGMVTFDRDWMGRYHIKSAAPLCGESRWVMDWQNPTEDLQSAVSFAH